MAFEHYDKCSLLLPMDGANNGTVFTDWSPVPKTITRVGAITRTDQFKYYDSSGFFDGTDDYIYAPNSEAFRFGSGDFTVEACVRFSSLASDQAIVTLYNTNSKRSWALQYSEASELRLLLSGNGTSPTIINRPVSLSTLVWYHIAATRQGDICRVWLDGQKVGADGSFSGSLYDNVDDPVIIGAQGQLGSGIGVLLNGRMQDVRITKGAALYTANFTPPTRLIGELSNSNAANPVEDETGTPVERRIFAVPRCYPTRMFTSVSDVNGDFTLRAPATECSVFAIHEGDPIKNDLIYRVTPV